MSDTKFSLVIPVYMNEESIPDLLSVLTEINISMSARLEVVFVVDGSPDNCYEILADRLTTVPFHSQLLLHSRNYGSFAAVRTGLEVAKGTFFAVMAADLQEPPALVIDFFNCLEADEADIILGARESRQDPLLSRFLSNVYWRFYSKFIIPDIPKGGVDVFACNLQFRSKLLELQECHTSLIGLIYWLGFRRKTLIYSRCVRKHGKSAWTFGRKVTYFMDSVFAFTDLPIRLLILSGSVGLLISVIFALLLILAKISGNLTVPGYAATVVAVLFFGGLNAVGLGIIGSYIWRAYGNTQQRPSAVVMRKTTFNN